MAVREGRVPMEGGMVPEREGVEMRRLVRKMS
jgi:hypothetical protein